MGFRERDHLVPEEARRQVAAHGRGKYEGPAGVRFLMIDGIAAGLWERKKRGKRIELQVTPSRKLTRAERAELDTEAERIGAFLGSSPCLRSNDDGRAERNRAHQVAQVRVARVHAAGGDGPAESLAESVPWIAMRFPPLQPAGRFGCVAESERMQQP